MPTNMTVNAMARLFHFILRLKGSFMQVDCHHEINIFPLSCAAGDVEISSLTLRNVLTVLRRII